jgi:SAM-dependent MidA family methyltransferase
LIANEVLDALPMTCFAWRDGNVQERGVGVDAGGAFAWRERMAAGPLREEVARLQLDAAVNWPEGYLSELCLRTGPWITALLGALTQGVALFIDYGFARRDYYRADRDRGTLRVHHRQRAHDDPFATPGLADLTAWVDFTRVAEAAEVAQWEVLGFAAQSALLLGLGIEAEVAAAPDDRTRVLRASEARRLLMPGEMGETFKAIALGRDFDAALAGFAHQDLRRML